MRYRICAETLTRHTECSFGSSYDAIQSMEDLILARSQGRPEKVSCHMSRAPRILLKFLLILPIDSSAPGSRVELVSGLVETDDRRRPESARAASEGTMPSLSRTWKL